MSYSPTSDLRSKPVLRRGYSLLELSIVVVIIALVIGMGFVSMKGVTQSSLQAQTERKLEVIEKALYDFRKANNRLPCPADPTIANGASNYGTENTGSNQCGSLHILASSIVDASTAWTGLEGVVPIKALGLPDEYMVDAWGRRFAYGVDPNATVPDAFFMNAPDSSCGIPVDDITGDGVANNRTTTAIYTLLSYGPNGHGGRTSTGGSTRVYGNTTNADELLNCHCDSGNPPSGGGTFVNYVQKAATEGTGAAATFDDILRFKERWQLQTSDDDRHFKYKGPDWVVGWVSSGNLKLSAFQHNCSMPKEKVIWGTGGLATPAGTDVAAVQFIPDNSKLFVYASTAPYCSLFDIAANTYSASATTIPSCPAHTTGAAAAISDNGYLAIGDTTADTVRLWRVADGAFTLLNPTSSDLSIGFDPRYINFSHNAEYMVVSSATAFKFYQRKPDGTGFVLTTTQPSPSLTYAYAKVSPNGRFVAAVTAPATNTLYIWKITTNPLAFTQVAGSPFSRTSVSPQDSLAFSPDSRYLFTPGLASGAINYIINNDDTVTAVSSMLPTYNYGRAYGTSPDGRMLLMGHGSNMVILRRATATSYLTTRYFPTSASGAATTTFQTLTATSAAQAVFRWPDQWNP